MSFTGEQEKINLKSQIKTTNDVLIGSYTSDEYAELVRKVQLKNQLIIMESLLDIMKYGKRN